jgi:UPF0755 protein
MARTLSNSSIVILLLIAALGLGTALGGRLFLFAVYPAAGTNTNPDGAIVEVARGQGPKELTHALVAGGILPADQEANFILLGRVARFWKHIKTGEYKVTAIMTPIELFKILDSGVSVLHPLTVREGENMYEIGDALEEMKLIHKDVFLKACANPKLIESLGFKAPLPKNLEGYLFPDTYFLSKTMSVEELIRTMYHKFSEVWGPEQDKRAAQLMMTRHQLITLASIVEKETGAPQERPMIASVFYNRLRKKMKLQSDPTTIYGIWSRYDGNIHKADLSTQNDYNTYFVAALPIGPISNPGKEAIQAVLFPGDSQFLYFVSHNDGTHEFTKTYEDHISAVRKFQLDPKAREGKSWRDLNKKKVSAVGST